MDESTINSLATIITEGWPDSKERRRYAVLNAAALLAINGLWESKPGKYVDGAEKLLAEIESREK